MWKTLHDSKPPLYLSFNEGTDGFQIYVTDYTSLWCVNFSKESFNLRLKECNDDLECESENELVQQGITMLAQPDKIKKLHVEKEDGDKILSICMNTSFGYPFKFECKLTKTSEQIFYQKVTKHLLKIINDLRSSQTKLRDMLKKKDKVIKAFKSKGVSLAARRLKVDAAEFNDEAHMSGHKEYESLFGANANPEVVLIKTELSSGDQSRPTIGTVKIESAYIKAEPETPITAADPTSSMISINTKQENIKEEPPSSNIVVKKRRTFNI